MLKPRSAPLALELPSFPEERAPVSTWGPDKGMRCEDFAQTKEIPTKKNNIDTVDGRNPAQFIHVLSHYLQGFRNIPGGWPLDF